LPAAILEGWSEGRASMSTVTSLDLQAQYAADGAATP